VALRKNRQGGGKKDLLALTAAFADVDVGAVGHKGATKYQDKAAAQAAIEAFPLRPSLLVDSGGGFQPYWLFREAVGLTPETITRLEEINRGLAQALGGDMAATDAARILRLPGTFNLKISGQPRPVQIVWCEPERVYDLGEFAPYEAQGKKGGPRAGTTTPGPPPGGSEYAAYGQKALDDELATLAKTPEGERNTRLNQSAFVLGQLVEAGALERGTVEVALSNVATSIGLGEVEAQATIKSGLEAGIKEPRRLPEKPHKPGGGKARGEEGPESKSKPTQAEILLRLAAGAELFHDPNHKCFASFPVSGHVETWPIRSGTFRDWLRGLFFKAHGKPPGGQALQDALETLAAQARFEGPTIETFVRTAHYDGKIFIDLANDAWQAVEITSQGWRVVSRPPVKFRRPRGLAPMPTPQYGGGLANLRPFVNCRNEDWPLVVAWICGAFSSGPYPILILQGEQGTAKTTTARALKSLVDPGHSLQRAAPKEIRDLMISAANSWCLSFDNLSDTRLWISDAFCRLATGGGLSTRELYSDDSEIFLDVRRPLVLNGIDSLVNRADLADRAILLELPPLQDANRRPEADLWREFEAAQPGILGAIFNSLAAALANVNSVKLARLPRMADFAVWVVAAEPALPWEAGSFLTAYDRNRAAVRDHSLEGDVVAVAVRSFMEHGQEWEGTPTELLNRLTEEAGDLVSRGKAWPKTANSLSNRLRRAAPFLRANGIHYESQRDRKARTIFLEKMGEKTVTTVTTVTPQESCGFPRDDPVTIPVMRDDPGEKTVTLKSRNHAGCDDVTVVTI
jgi:hypothetical protein